MKNMKHIIFAIVLLIPLSFAYAQTKITVNCDSAATQVEMNFCAEQGFRDADKELNSVYRQLMQVLRSGRNTKDSAQVAYNKKLENAVIQAQKKWLEFRDSCANVWRVKYEGGSVMPVIYYGVMTSLTRAQTRELQDVLNDSK